MGMQAMMPRRATNDLWNWFNSKDRKPLIIRGARQTGKSTLVRLFAQNHKLDLIEINLEKNKINTIHNDNFDIDLLVAEIESLTHKKVHNNTLVFLDEVQTDAKMITRLRYFYEERPDVAVVCAGSLLEIALHQETVSFPVGRVSFYFLGPMTFTEYLSATGKEDWAQAIVQNEVKDFLHEPINEELKKFFYIGGMPKAISTYLDVKSFHEVREIQRDIIQTYISDFPKYGKRLNISRLETVFQKVPFYLGKKLIYQHIDREHRSSEIRKAVELLVLANIVLPVYHAESSGIPLRSTIDHSIAKYYLLDIGLLNCFHQFDWSDMNDMFEESFLTKGLLAEQFVAQHLAYRFSGKYPPELNYWLRDKTVQKAEIDFVIQRNKKIVPIEVKAQSGGRLKSIRIFAEEKKISEGIKLSKKWYDEENLRLNKKQILHLKNLPLYSVESIS